MASRKTTNWVRFMLKLGLLATDASVWLALNRMLTERSDGHMREKMAADLGVRPRSSSGFKTLLTGVGIGVGLGLLFAPMSGQETRGALRDKAEGVRDKWNDVAAWAGLGPEMSRRTGTYAD